MASSTVFTYGPANVDTLLTLSQSVLAKLSESGYLNDAIFNFIPLFNWLRQKTQVTKSGGASILVPLMYAKNTTFAAYSGTQQLDTTVQEGLTMAQFQWRNYGGTISLVGDELRMNAGQGKLFDYVKAKTEQALMSARDTLSIDLFAATQGAKKISSLPVLVDTTSSVADINSTTNSWWQAQVTASGSFPGRGLADLRTLRDNILQRGQAGGAAPDYIVTTALVKQLYEASQVSAIRYEQAAAADASFENLKFSTAVMEFDPNVATGELYMLPSSNLQLVVHEEANFNIGNFVEPTNQDARTAKVLTMLQLVTNNRRRLGKLTGITA